MQSIWYNCCNWWAGGQLAPATLVAAIWGVHWPGQALRQTPRPLCIASLPAAKVVSRQCTVVVGSKDLLRVQIEMCRVRLHNGSMAAAPCDRRGSPAAAQPPIAESQPVLARRQRASSVWRAALLQVPGVSFATSAGALLRPLMHWEPAAGRVDWACPF